MREALIKQWLGAPKRSGVWPNLTTQHQEVALNRFNYFDPTTSWGLENEIDIVHTHTACNISISCQWPLGNATRSTEVVREDTCEWLHGAERGGAGEREREANLLFMKFKTAAARASINLFHHLCHFCVTEYARRTACCCWERRGCALTPSSFNRHRVDTCHM